MRIAAVIVTYNRADELCRCLNAVTAQKISEGNALDIIVVDNDSTDGTRDAVSAYTAAAENGSPESGGPAVHYYNTGCNAGGAGGFAFGLQKAYELGCDACWIMDDDCVPQPQALGALLEADRQLGGDYGFLSSKVLWTDGSLCTMNMQRRTLTRSIKRRQLEKAGGADLIPAAMASFVSLFVPMGIIRRFGLPIKEFFIWTDDWEFTRRISRKYPCYVVPASTVVHETRENAGADIASAPENRLDRFRYLYRNDVYLYRREGLKGFAYEAVRLTWHLIRILRSRAGKRAGRAGILIRGTAQGLRFHPEPGRLTGSGGAPEKPASPIRVLEAFGEPISFGGQEAFVMNVLEHMDRTGMKIDLLSPYFCDNDRTVSVIHGYGGEVYALNCPFKPGSLRQQAVKQIRAFFKEHRYDVVHIHSGSNIMLAMLAASAARSGAGRVIVHSHCTGVPGWKHTLSKMATAPVLIRYATEYCACSREAGQWRFPAAICRRKLTIVYNGIEADSFRFNEQIRARMRRELGIGEKTAVIGNVGRLTAQKNQVFLLELMRDILRDNPGNKYRLLLVGGGDDMPMLKRKAAQLGIGEQVIFAGACSNVADYYQAIDVLAVPSLYEGLAIVVIEGQAAGLEIVASDRIPGIAAVTDTIQFVSLDDRQEWIDRLTAVHRRYPEQAQEILESLFSAQQTARVVRDMYVREDRRRRR